MIHITKYLVSIKLHFVCFLIGFLLFMNIFYFYYFIPIAKRIPINSILREVSPNMLFNFLPL